MTCLSQSNKGNFYRQFFKAEHCANLLPISFFPYGVRLEEQKQRQTNHAKEHRILLMILRYTYLYFAVL